MYIYKGQDSNHIEPEKRHHKFIFTQKHLANVFFQVNIKYVIIENRGLTLILEIFEKRFPSFMLKKPVKKGRYPKFFITFMKKRI